jgi:DNA-binding NarL/FixJ family response regulator
VFVIEKGARALVTRDNVVVTDRDLLRPSRTAPGGSARPLTARELDMVRLVARGLTNSEIADELVVSLSTVKCHVSSAQAKLGARNRVQVAVWAWRTGHAPVPVREP